MMTGNSGFINLWAPHGRASFSRRLQAFCAEQGIPIIEAGSGERKHELAEPHVPQDLTFSGLFLPELISRLGQIHLFVHDSRHTERNVRFQLDRAWAALRPNGAVVVDDVDANWGFRSFTQTFSGHQSMICEAEPLHPDLGASTKRGYAGHGREDDSAVIKIFPGVDLPRN
jgi:hypothetical protein